MTLLTLLTLTCVCCLYCISCVLSAFLINEMMMMMMMLSSILQSRQQPVSSSSWSTASLLSSNQVVRPTDIHSSHSSTDYYKYSFLPRTIVDWNSLPFSLRAKPSVDSFRAGLQHLTVSRSSHWAERQHSSSNGLRPLLDIPPKYRREWSGEQEVEVQGHTRSKSDWWTWRRHYSRVE